MERQENRTENINFDDRHIEELLTPRCDFHVSPDFKDKVMAETRTVATHRRRHPQRRIVAAAAAAAIVIAILVAIPTDNNKEGVRETPVVLTESSRLAPAKTRTKYTNENKTSINKPKTSTRQQKKAAIPEFADKGQRTLPQKTERKMSSQEEPTELLPAPDIQKEIIPVSEGEMPMAYSEKKEVPNPDEVRKRLIESRRREETAYLDLLRQQIAANDALITQLMTSENVYQSDTQLETPF